MSEQSNRGRNIGFGLVALVMVGGLVWAAVMLLNRTPASPKTTTESQSSAPRETSESPSVTILFGDNGFSPSSYTVKVGQVVEVKNNSSDSLEFSSDNHPTHTDETELNLGRLAPGESGRFTPTRVGTWGFHDHLRDELTGTLTVTE